MIDTHKLEEETFPLEAVGDILNAVGLLNKSWVGDDYCLMGMSSQGIHCKVGWVHNGYCDLEF